MIASFINGRARIRNPRFKDPDAAATAAAELKTRPGVLRASANPATGGILLEYNPLEMEPEAAFTILAELDPEGFDDFLTRLANLEAQAASAENQPAPGRNNETAEYATLLLAFLVCSSSAFLRSKGLHVYSGLSLAGLTIQHVLKYRRRIMGILLKDPAD
ncbi:MAG: hypothetical protein LBP55_07735 [Candidatus Adiutrix sp.]|jgi:hypothetical protein|nr:hypothetical protein [Candidatus Adiutrix sp.]